MEGGEGRRETEGGGEGEEAMEGGEGRGETEGGGEGEEAMEGGEGRGETEGGGEGEEAMEGGEGRGETEGGGEGGQRQHRWERGLHHDGLYIFTIMSACIRPPAFTTAHRISHIKPKSATPSAHAPLTHTTCMYI